MNVEVRHLQTIFVVLKMEEGEKGSGKLRGEVDQEPCPGSLDVSTWRRGNSQWKLKAVRRNEGRNLTENSVTKVRGMTRFKKKKVELVVK